MKIVDPAANFFMKIRMRLSRKMLIKNSEKPPEIQERPRTARLALSDLLEQPCMALMSGASSTSSTQPASAVTFFFFDGAATPLLMSSQVLRRRSRIFMAIF